MRGLISLTFEPVPAGLQAPQKLHTRNPWGCKAHCTSKRVLKYKFGMGFSIVMGVVSMDKFDLRQEFTTRIYHGATNKCKLI